MKRSAGVERALPPLSSLAAAVSVTATKAGPAPDSLVQQQVAMMGYIDVFFLLAIMFAACLPLILIMKKAPKGGGGPGAMAH